MVGSDNFPELNLIQQNEQIFIQVVLFIWAELN